MEDLEKKFHSELEIALFGADVIITSGGGGGGGGCNCDGDTPCIDCGCDGYCGVDCGVDGPEPCSLDGICSPDCQPLSCGIDCNCVGECSSDW